MKVAIMQPYFFPYLGYFQLMAAVDVFIVYDNIQYTKKGWINRNRLLRNGEAAVFSLPLQNASDFLEIRERSIAADFKPEKLLNKFAGAYRHAPGFASVFPLIDEIVRYEEANLFRFLYHSIRRTCEYLDIRTQLRISSEMDVDHGLTKQEKVLAICRAAGAATYVNSIGGVDLYSSAEFRKWDVDLKFLRSAPFEYGQFDHDFTPLLSIVDVLMFNPIETVRARLSSGYELI
jgi:hypothetical protein